MLSKLKLQDFLHLLNFGQLFSEIGERDMAENDRTTTVAFAVTSFDAFCFPFWQTNVE